MRYLLASCLVVVVAMATTLPVLAIEVRVDWSVDNPDFPAPNPGPGHIEGSLGVFDVSAVGQTFTLLADGSLTAVASGYPPAEFRNGDYAFTRNFSSGPLILEFLSIGNSPADFSVRFTDSNRGLLSPVESCTVGGVNGNCFIVLFDDTNDGTDRAAARFSTGGTTPPTSEVTFTFSMCGNAVVEVVERCDDGSALGGRAPSRATEFYPRATQCDHRRSGLW